MNLYVDDDSVHHLLVRLLQRAGHDVEVPSDAGLIGESDPIHLKHAIDSNRRLLSANYDDFEELHDLIIAAGGKHPGILIAAATMTAAATSRHVALSLPSRTCSMLA
jgi:hypothetical protein